MYILLLCSLFLLYVSDLFLIVIYVVMAASYSGMNIQMYAYMYILSIARFV